MKYLLAILLLASSAYAADLHCGRDTDRSGAVDNACPTGDADFDGEPTATDCDDTDWSIYRGIWVDAGGGNVKQCLSSGSYDSNVAVASFTCASTCDNTYWVDDAETTCDGAGTRADPKDYRCFSDAAMSGYHALVAGDCVVFMAGTYTAKHGSAPEKMIFVSGRTGTSADPIHLCVEPGATVQISGQGSSPNNVYPIEIVDSAYVYVSGNSIGKRGGLVVLGNYAAGGVDVHNSDNIVVRNAYIYDVDGNCGSSNCGGVKSWGGADATTVSHCIIADTYNRAAATNENAANIYASGGDGHLYEYNVLLAASSSVVANQILFKHGDADSPTWTAKGNVFNTNYGPQIRTACGGALINHNVFLAPSSIPITFKGGGGGTHFEANSVVELNTVVNGPAIELFDPNSDENSTTFGTVTFQNNVVVDNRGTAYSSADAYLDGFYRIAHYADDALYGYTNDKISIVGNCIYNSAATAIGCSIFGGNGTYGDTTADFSEWDALSFTTGEVNEDPELNADNIATSTNCSTKGWNATATTTTTTTTSTTTLAWTQRGINFRGSLAYVTDGTDQSACYASYSARGCQYPTEISGVTYGWTTYTDDMTRDRNTTHSRLAGTHFKTNNGTPLLFRVDLPAIASYKICLALGDYSYSRGYHKAEVFDNTTSKFTVVDSDGTSDANFTDAAGNNNTAANWISSNGGTCQTGVSFASTTLILKLGSTDAQTGDSCIAHLYIERETPVGGIAAQGFSRASNIFQFAN